ncbi:hypothetical protein E4U42_000652, partial [Claviceps africana]
MIRCHRTAQDKHKTIQFLTQPPDGSRPSNHRVRIELQLPTTQPPWLLSPSSGNHAMTCRAPDRFSAGRATSALKTDSPAAK